MKMSPLTGRNCIVTGGTAGIGFVTACELAGMGADVTIVGRDRDRGEAATAAIAARTNHGSIHYVQADLSRQTSPVISTLYHWTTGSSVYDQNGLSAPLQFRIDQDLERFAGSFEQALSRLRVNWESMTSEVLQTDRMDIPGDTILTEATPAVSHCF